MKKGRKFMLVIALLLTILPLVGCGEKAKENEIKKYKEDNYTEVSEDTKSDFWKGVIKSYVTTDRNIIVRQKNNEKGPRQYVIYGYDYNDHDYENVLWSYETKKIYEGEYLDTLENPDNEDILFVIEDEKISSLDTKTGKINWSIKLSEIKPSAFLVYEGKLFLMDYYHTEDILILDVATGKLLKSLNFKSLDSYELYLTGIIGDELIITDYSSETIYSLNVNTGSIKESKITFAITEDFYEE